jgi:predicted DNA-binding transcriptional regulator AlpA
VDDVTAEILARLPVDLPPFLNTTQVVESTGLGMRTILSRAGQKGFPRPFVAQRKRWWRTSEVRKFLTRLLEETASVAS